MIRLHSYKGKKIGVFGLSRTGVSVCKSLACIADLVVYDEDLSKLNQFTTELPSAAKYSVENITEDAWKHCDFIVLSPGIPLQYPSPHPIVQIARKHNISIKSDIDLLYNELPTRKYIGITGTNGKSTTASLLCHILNSTGSNFALGGNIGQAVLSLDDKVEGYVIELSSFHLDMTTDLQLDIAMLLNITPDHIDRHGSFEQYKLAKYRIFSLLKQDSCAVINKELSDVIKSDISNNILSENSKIITFSPSLFQHLDLACSLIGQHNRQNIAAALTACKILGKKDEDIIYALKQFTPLDHRMQFIGAKHSINFYNDSKATNDIAARQSLSSLSNIYWLAGGVAKEGSIKSILDVIEANVLKAYLYGTSRHDFALILSKKIAYSIHENMEDAFQQAITDMIADQGYSKNMLLSPACASYDQFISYEDRGNRFIQLVQSFIQKNNI